MSMSVAAHKVSKPSQQGDVMPTYPDLPVPRTPLEQRVGPHPKKDYLIWKTPPTRQLSRAKRREFEADISERFYDDYLGTRSTGDAKNEVLTGLSKVGFHPDYYRLNAAHTFAYDPARPVPRSVDLNQLVRNETAKERERLQTQMRQRRLSDPQVMQYFQHGQSSTIPQLPSVSGAHHHSHHGKSSGRKLINEALNPEIAPEVEKWMTSASAKEREVASNFLRTISSQGQRPDPATKASTHRSRVRSAVLTPSQTQRKQQHVTDEFRRLERESAAQSSGQRGAGRREAPRRKVKRSMSESSTSGGMFSPLRQQPAHFTIHPEWASESANKY